MKRNGFFAVIMFLLAIFAFAQSESDFQVELTADYTGAVITRYTGQGISALRIPNTIQSFPVKEIKQYVFQNNKTITSVVLPSSIEKIGEGAFYDCGNLSVVTIPANVTKIEFVTKVVKNSAYARGQYEIEGFSGCNLNFPSQAALKLRGYPGNFGEKRFGYYTVSLTNDYTGLVITRFENVRAVKFMTTNTSEYTISNLDIQGNFEGMVVKELGAKSFGLNIDDQPSREFQIEGRVVIPEGVEVIRERAFSSSVGWKKHTINSVVLPSTLKIIEERAFAGSVLTQVNIPQNTKVIGNNAFAYCTKLNSVILPEGITEIGEGAFIYCSSLTSITLPSTIKTIGKEAFSGTGLTTISIPEAVVTIGENAFAGTKFPLPIQAELRRRGYIGRF